MLEVKEEKKPSALLLLKIFIGIACFCGYTWILTDSATKFGYTKGFEKGVAQGMAVQKYQNDIDCQNAQEKLQNVKDVIDSISIVRSIIRIPYDSAKRTITIKR